MKYTTFQGLSKGKEAMFLVLIRQFASFLPALYGLKEVLGITGVWISMPVSDILGITVAGVWLMHEYRQQKKNAWESQQIPGQTAR